MFNLIPFKMHRSEWYSFATTTTTTTDRKWKQKIVTQKTMVDLSRCVRLVKFVPTHKNNFNVFNTPYCGDHQRHHACRLKVAYLCNKQPDGCWMWCNYIRGNDDGVMVPVSAWAICNMSFPSRNWWCIFNAFRMYRSQHSADWRSVIYLRVIFGGRILCIFWILLFLQPALHFFEYMQLCSCAVVHDIKWTTHRYNLDSQWFFSKAIIYNWSLVKSNVVYSGRPDDYDTAPPISMFEPNNERCYILGSWCVPNNQVECTAHNVPCAVHSTWLFSIHAWRHMCKSNLFCPYDQRPSTIRPGRMDALVDPAAVWQFCLRQVGGRTNTRVWRM